ncbi:oxygen-independent coproporphyrinogen III oxidase [Aureibaculum sp. 2210JD6-5]|uniref:oxygen-independent coproporphyrinogen III oxidase n=1 Tax=Aureibaculum sp. 2210JD6-5 TaxID=3103957 RepID=UPI002AAC871A|nr:oxygen-independent coproporphyrinogen III oxidase [Aureibaculum sp. 2210JD6-5]MDY7396689.1 oxygen-independent coproporphyrinogen III oxidase [Aureibaculum sp. 2210JD6-5]
MSKSTLIQKYNVPGPRYTSYPTVPYWDERSIDTDKWIRTIKHSFEQSNSSKGISLYIHLPFCESLCTFCACHKYITKRHEVETPYIETLLKEWGLYLQQFNEKPLLRELHLGGGTPTFFEAENLEYLIKTIFSTVDLHSEFEFSFEGHPNNTTKEHLQTLYNLGFTRVSYGVQDYAEKVQKAINRVQPFDNVKKVTEWAREIGYTSISHDLIFGLPFQTVSNIIDTIKKTMELKPERISFYSYAHVPWIKGVGQRGFKESDIPKGNEKIKLYEMGKHMLLNFGYVETGMDHFALPSDALCKAFNNANMHRNFMGYTTNPTQLMIGLGMSAISDSWFGFAQNEKSLKAYQVQIEKGQIPLLKGHLLTEEDLIIRQHILNVMCHFKTSWQNDKLKFTALPETLDRLKELEKDGLVLIADNELIVPKNARAFVRNICMAFDLRMVKNKPDTQLFSMTV